MDVFVSTTTFRKLTQVFKIVGIHEIDNVVWCRVTLRYGIVLTSGGRSRYLEILC